jgi:hypothetical protein
VRILPNKISCFEPLNRDCRKSRAGVSPPRVGEADALLALTRSRGRRDACPTLGSMVRADVNTNFKEVFS